jgi:hypothetical protein
MDKKYTTIYAYVYCPSDKKSKAVCTSVHCSNAQNCGLYKRNECILIGALNTQSCPYGKYYRTHGFTKMAKNYYSWINKQREQYKDVESKISSFRYIMSEIGDYIFLPYSHMNMNENIPFFYHGGIFTNGSYLLPKEHFTIPNIIKICEFRPYALTGGEITSYQLEEIPKFLQHLSQEYPEIFKELCNHYERAKKLSTTFSNVGRKAYLRTLTPNVSPFVDIHGGIWHWDGQYLTSNNSKMSFGLINNFTEIRLTPHPNTIVEISDDKQVNDNTSFI